MAMSLEAGCQLFPGMLAGYGHSSSETLSLGKLLAALLLVAAVLTGAAALRSFEYDEAYSVFVTSGTPRPDWPTTPFRVGETRGPFTAHAGFTEVARALRQTDVHPPLYFWVLAAWRRVVGDGLLALRLLSVLCGLAALAAVGGIARQAGVPAASAMLLTAGCYGFAYTSAIARGFALAQALALAGVLLALVAAERGRGRTAFAAGLVLGAASFTNYLSAFVGIASLLWLLIAHTRRVRLWIACGVGPPVRATWRRSAGPSNDTLRQGRPVGQARATAWRARVEVSRGET
ncbi:MAG: glycosyltransferase family 39 protein [Pseudomonadota bacterium]|nr:glycosyltransferase family 39 protein [Pseudomonadota bacterium]